MAVIKANVRAPINRNAEIANINAFIFDHYLSLPAKLGALSTPFCRSRPAGFGRASSDIKVTG